MTYSKSINRERRSYSKSSKRERRLLQNPATREDEPRRERDVWKEFKRSVCGARVECVWCDGGDEV